MRAALSPHVLGLLGIGITERICYGLATIYFATFLQAIYGLSLAGSALPLAIFALGNIAGTVLGGQLADRLRDRLLTFAVAMALSAVRGARPVHVASRADGLGGAGLRLLLLNALGRPSYMAALASVPDDVRGTVLGLNGTSASVGWVGAAALGRADDQYRRLRGLRAAGRAARPAGRGRGAGQPARQDFYLRVVLQRVFPALRSTMFDGPSTTDLDPAERRARLRLARSPRIGPVNFHEALQHFGSARRACRELPVTSRGRDRPRGAGAR